MSNKGFWDDAWLDVQKNYWENWSELSRKAMGLDQPKVSPWEQGLDHWWRAVSPAAPDPAKGFMEKMLDQGKAFFRMGEEFAKNLQGPGQGTDWSEALTRTFGDLQQAFTGAGQGQGEEALHKMMAFWEMPLDNWQRMVSSLSLVPGDLLRNMPHGAEAGHLDKFLSVPGLGYAREEQGQQQELLRLVLNYQRELQAYLQFFSQLGVESVDCMRRKTLEQTDQDKPIESARTLYDLWVQSCEEIYSEQVRTPKYAQLHGRLVNALMALKRHQGSMVDEALGAMNMPTRTELRTLQDRVQEARRENKRLRAELEALAEKVEKLGRPAAASASAPAPTPARQSVGAAASAPAAAPAKKAAPRRKTAVKRAPAANSKPGTQTGK
jgi:class III poly(R)-hydroxyalkanoic acid synthase PhaE subunit